MYALIPALGALPWAPERGHVSTGYELPNSLPSASLQQLQALVIEFSTQQQLAFEAHLIAAARVHHTTTNTMLTHPDNGQAQPYTRVSNATTPPTQLGPAQTQCKHARVSGSICEFLHSCLTRAAERECTRTTDVSKDIQSGGAAIHSGGATKNARSGVSSADARDVTAEHECTRTTDVGEDIYSQNANTDARSGDASADACNVTQESAHQQSVTQSERAPNLESASSADETKTSASSAVVINKDAYRYGATNGARSGDLRADACTVSHLTCDTKVLITLLTQPRTESSSQPCLEHALRPQLLSGQQSIKCANLKDYSPATCQQFRNSLRAR